MFLTWYGLSCFKIQEKETTAFTDPYSNETGLRPPRLSNADIISVSRKDLLKNVKTMKDDALIISGSGEYEARGVMINGIPASYSKEEGENTIYTIKVSGMVICHLGTQHGDLTDEELDKIDGVDILLIPIGGGTSFSTEQAIQVINKIEPRIVIPINYKIPKLKPKLESLDKFCKEMGAPKNKVLPKLTIKKKNLPQGETQVVLLEPQG